jgi:RNA polymerase sigma-70 factor (ECF subfamily)
MDTTTTASAPTPPVTARSFRGEIVAMIPDLRAFARFLVRDPVAADDVVQETLVRALPAVARLPADAALKPWLFTIVRHVFYEQERRRRTERRVMADFVADDAAAPARQEGHSDVVDLQRLLWTLSPVLREALVLVGAQGMSVEEAAVICDVPVNTMKARVARARARLAAARMR